MTTALLFREHEVEEIEDWSSGLDRLGKKSLLWIDLECPDEDTLEELASSLELQDESLRRLTSDETKPFLGDFGRYLHVTAYAPCGDDRTLTRVGCLVAEGWIVTVRGASVDVVEEVRERAEGSGDVGRLDGLDFLANLLAWVLEGYLRAFEELDVALETFDARVMEGGASPDDDLQQLVGLRAEVGRLRRAVVAHRSVLLALTRPELERISTTDSAERFAALLARLEEVVQAARDSRESVVGSFEVMMTQVNQRTNEIMKVLTLASILFLPGTLIAGVLGMNFKVGLFDTASFFWLALAAIVGIVGIAAATLTVARARRWL